MSGAVPISDLGNSHDPSESRLPSEHQLMLPGAEHSNIIRLAQPTSLDSKTAVNDVVPKYE